MKVIQKFQAFDGSEFGSETECRQYEELCSEIEVIMSQLPKRPSDDGCRFSNGRGFLQHREDVFFPVRDALLRIGNRISPHKWFDQSMANRTVHPSWAGRIIDETSRPLAQAWYRIMCVDSDLREWGQPYYANNPDQIDKKDMVAL